MRRSDASEGLIERDEPTTAYPALRKPSARPAPMPWEAPVTITTLRGALDSPTRGVPDGSLSRMDGSSDEIYLVDHTSRLPAADTDEYAFVQPVEALGPGLDLD